MKKRKSRKRGWFGKALLGTALGLSHPGGILFAQAVPAPTAMNYSPYRQRDLRQPTSVPARTAPTAPTDSPYRLCDFQQPVSVPVPTAPVAVTILPTASAESTSALADSEIATMFSGGVPTEGCDPIAPAWCDPISRVPNFFGDFVGRGTQACRNTLTTQTITSTRTTTHTTTSTTPLAFTGSGAEGGGFASLVPPFVGINGPGGPYTLTQPIPIVPPSGGNFTLGQNPELSPLVRAKFPGATFVNGGGAFLNATTANFFYNYLFTSTQTTTNTIPFTQTITTGQNICVNLPNPAGGGLIGRNDFFDNGAALPQDRVYFFYNHVGNFQGLGSPFDVNRYVFGVEKTFFDRRLSIEVRVPFAGTADGDQVGGDNLAVGHTEFGNVGLAVKGVVYRSPNFLVSLGLGFSLPTASDSRMLIGDAPVVVIQNRTCLLHPLLGVAWAPNDRFYTQLGVQFDIDPTGNPVQALDVNGNLSRVGVLHDQTYAQLNAAAGYWLYQSNNGWLSGIALQGELHYDSSFGRHDAVQDGIDTVSDLANRINVLNGTAGAIFRFGERSNLSVGISFPLAGERLYDWNVIAQVNVQFGGPTR